MLVYRRNKPHKASAPTQKKPSHWIWRVVLWDSAKENLGVPAVFATFSQNPHERNCWYWLVTLVLFVWLWDPLRAPFFVFWSLSLHGLKIDFIEHRIPLMEDFIPKGGTILQYRYSYIKTTHPTVDPDDHSSTHWVFPTSRWFTKDIFCQAKVCYCIAQAQDGGTAVSTRWPRITRVETHNLRRFEGTW